MIQIVKKCPVRIVGLMLGLAQVGNLVQSYGEVYRNTLGIISVTLLVLIICKIVIYPKDVVEALNNPAIASVFPTLSMGLMVLSTYLKIYSTPFAFAIWVTGVALHVALILWFTKKFVFDFKIKNVLPSWFIVYVGVVTTGVTASTFGMENIGRIAFGLGFVNYLILLPIVIYRVVKVREMPEQTLPTLAIFSAPASLLLAAYMNSFATKSMTMVWFLMALSIIMYVTVIIVMLFKLLKLKFYPSYSAFTFPLIISAISIKLVNEFLIKSGGATSSLQYLIRFQEVVAVTITLYVLVRYIKFLLTGNNTILVTTKISK